MRSNARKLLSQDDMLNGISLATILPGPVAVNTVAYTGYRIRGWAGAVTAATAVMTPSFLLMLLLTRCLFSLGLGAGCRQALQRFYSGSRGSRSGRSLEHGQENDKDLIGRPDCNCFLPVPYHGPRLFYYGCDHRGERSARMAALQAGNRLRANRPQRQVLPEIGPRRREYE